MHWQNKIVLALIISLITLAGKASSDDCSISFLIQNEKEVYTINDTITVLIKVALDKEFCDEAGDATKVFSNGLRIIKRSKWKKTTETTIAQKLVLTVLSSKKERTLTAYRKTAHYNCFKQQQFEVEKE